MYINLKTIKKFYNKIIKIIKWSKNILKILYDTLDLFPLLFAAWLFYGGEVEYKNKDKEVENIFAVKDLPPSPFQMCINDKK